MVQDIEAGALSALPLGQHTGALWGQGTLMAQRILGEFSCQTPADCAELVAVCIHQQCELAPSTFYLPQIFVGRILLDRFTSLLQAARVLKFLHEAAGGVFTWTAPFKSYHYSWKCVNHLR